jgi:catechol 2,3-dioxygenase-like lactoylglutathione lyase family enzyme
MTDHATPNLSARDFDATLKFYGSLGFETSYRDDGWMILERGTITLEFFRYPDLDPAASAFGACLRLDDADAFVETCLLVGVPDRRIGWPRLHPIVRENWGGRVGALIDPDGSLLRVIDNRSL